VGCLFALDPTLSETYKIPKTEEIKKVREISEISEVKVSAPFFALIYIAKWDTPRHRVPHFQPHTHPQFSNF
jgi:hypothetical protein